jgi:hypothetical protein
MLADEERTRMKMIILLLVGCAAVWAQISPELFRHHFIARELPGPNIGVGSTALIDFDGDGDLDLVLLNRGDRKLYLFEQRSRSEWVRREVGELPVVQLGALPLDVDGDGRIDLIVGGYWFRNTGDPGAPFVRYQYDARIRTEIHDLSAADIDGDGRLDVVAIGDKEGLFWYTIPAKPAAGQDWPRTVITIAVLDEFDDVHGSFHPAGIADLDGDGDADIVLPDGWLENRHQGREWVKRRFHFGKRGPWGISSRSWITDLNGDGRPDIVMVDCDGQNSGLAWLENLGGAPPRFQTHYLANRAPGTRGSYHSLQLADFDGDGDLDILTAEQEAPDILPQGATPRWFIWENLTAGGVVRFEERLILDARLGGHDLMVGDIDGDGDPDIASKIWRAWKDNGNAGRVHVDWLENLRKKEPRD